MNSIINKAVALSIILHFIWFIMFFATIFGFESVFINKFLWLGIPLYGFIISVFALTKKTAQVGSILSIIFSISTFILWLLVSSISNSL
jgi:hypothetical protein